MWIASTYLGKPDPNATAFVFFFWNKYAENREAPEKLVEYLRRAGNLFGPDVTFLVPNPKDIERVSNEINRGKLRDFAREIHRHCPCLMLTRKPLADFDPNTDSYMFFGIPDESASDEDYKDFFAGLHRHVADAANSRAGNVEGLIERVWNSIDLSPNIGGFGFNLKKLFTPIDRQR